MLAPRFLLAVLRCAMLSKPPRRTAAPAKDALGEAFRQFGLDPNTPGDPDKLLQLMAQRLFPPRARRGRPKGVNRSTIEWRIQLSRDAAAIQERHSAKLKSAKLARLLKEEFPERYCHVSAGWLRQCLVSSPASVIRRVEDAFDWYESAMIIAIQELSEKMFTAERIPAKANFDRAVDTHLSRLVDIRSDLVSKIPRTRNP
jgi:hypothetical protein